MRVDEIRVSQSVLGVHAALSQAVAGAAPSAGAFALANLFTGTLAVVEDKMHDDQPL